MKILTKEFWTYAGERAIKTFAQTAVAYFGAGSVGLFTVDWVAFLSVSLGSAVLSLLTSIASAK